MKKVFADTSYWIALLNPRDGLHAKAVAMPAQLPSVSLVTSEMVLAELLNGLGDAGPWKRSAAISAVETIRRTHSISVFPQTSDQFAIAFERYKQSADKNWSLTDCASFQIMEDEHITAALTHDHHFVQAGFDALLR
jgi:predicted nucleic acid-binding protein